MFVHTKTKAYDQLIAAAVGTHEIEADEIVEAYSRLEKAAKENARVRELSNLVTEINGLIGAVQYNQLLELGLRAAELRNSISMEVSLPEIVDETLTLTLENAATRGELTNAFLAGARMAQQRFLEYARS